ncbi:hypothetical protein Aduo_004855 [Ancylostoma duodenale]
MGERAKPPISLSFASIRLNDLSDDYGFGDDGDTTVVDDDVVEEAQEASTGSFAKLLVHSYVLVPLT